jgi:hypothetical protein
VKPSLANEELLGAAELKGRGHFGGSASIFAGLRRKKNARLIISAIIARLLVVADARLTNMMCWLLVMGTGLTLLGGRLMQLLEQKRCFSLQSMLPWDFLCGWTYPKPENIGPTFRRASSAVWAWTCLLLGAIALV